MDHQESKAFEAEVALALPPAVVNKTDSTTEIDFWRPGYYLEVKEKKQKLNERWHLIDVPEEDLFILDELSYRKMMEQFPFAYCLMRDRPGNRLFLASVTELSVCTKVRRNRKTSESCLKGKLILNLAEFRQIESLEVLDQTITEELASLPWKVSECIGENIALI